MTQAERDRLVALKKAKKKLITQKQAAEELGITERHVRRLLRELKRRGDKIVAHGLRGVPVAAGVPGIWADVGVGIPGPETQHRGESGDFAAVDDGSQAVAGGQTARRKNL